MRRESMQVYSTGEPASAGQIEMSNMTMIYVDDEHGDEYDHARDDAHDDEHDDENNDEGGETLRQHSAAVKHSSCHVHTVVY